MTLWHGPSTNHLLQLTPRPLALIPSAQPRTTVPPARTAWLEAGWPARRRGAVQHGGSQHLCGNTRLLDCCCWMFSGLRPQTTSLHGQCGVNQTIRILPHRDTRETLVACRSRRLDPTIHGILSEASQRVQVDREPVHQDDSSVDRRTSTVNELTNLTAMHGNCTAQTSDWAAPAAVERRTGHHCSHDVSTDTMGSSGPNGRRTRLASAMASARPVYSPAF